MHRDRQRHLDPPNSIDQQEARLPDVEVTSPYGTHVGVNSPNGGTQAAHSGAGDIVPTATSNFEYDARGVARRE